MTLDDTLREARGVAPVVSVLMLVAISVVLASIIGAWALGLGNPADPATVGPSTEAELPDLSFSFTYYPGGGDALRTRFTDGEVVGAERLDLVVQGTPDADGRYGFTDALGAAPGRFETQERVRLNGTTARTEGPLRLEAATVRVVWTSYDGSHSETVAIWVGTEA